MSEKSILLWATSALLGVAIFFLKRHLDHVDDQFKKIDTRFDKITSKIEDQDLVRVQNSEAINEISYGVREVSHRVGSLVSDVHDVKKKVDKIESNLPVTKIQKIEENYGKIIDLTKKIINRTEAQEIRIKSLERK